MMGRQGGKRPGAGRPPKADQAPTRRLSLVLELDLVERAKAIGTGNVSEGIRRAIRNTNPPTDTEVT